MAKNRKSLFQKLQQSWNVINKWFLDTPQRALITAYEAALKIRDIEDTHFNGQKISSESTEYTANVLSYWQAELEKNLKKINFLLKKTTQTPQKHRLGCTGCQHSQLLELVQRLKP
ncbi:MAG: hypothetical protein AAFR83_22875, partial [Cyanobacteria bacterium J06629_18]